MYAGLQQEQPSLYDSLTKILDAPDQQVLQGVIQEAETRAIVAQQIQQQQSATSPVGGVHPLSSPTRPIP
jgi:hypothetical protein